jgi:hypothetical protein
VVDIAAARAGDRDEIEQRTEEELVHRVFAALPQHMREVLWASEVDGLSHAEIAARTGATTAAVAQLIVRARRLLGERYLDAHLPGAGAALPAPCVATRRVLAEVVRGTASATQRHLADDHLASCTTCVSASDHLRVVNHRLRAGHLLALAPALTASKPVRLGVLARLFGWLFGSAPVITASAALVLVAVVAPERPTPAAASAPTMVVVTPDVTVDLPSPAAGTVEPNGASTDAPPASRPAAGAVTDPVVVPGPTPTAPAMPAAADPAISAVPVAEPVPTNPVDNADAPPADETRGAVADRATGAVEQIVDGLGVDDGLVAAAGPALGALPPADVGVQIPAVELGAVGSTPPVVVAAGTGGGTLDVTAGAGSAQVSVGVGGPGGVHVDLPGAAALPDDD